MCYEQLGEVWNKTKWIDPLGQAVVEHATDHTSDAAESLGERWNWPMLANEARYNKEHTSEAIGKVGVGAASWWAGNGGLDGLLGAAGSAAGSGAGLLAGGATPALTAAEIAALQSTIGTEGLMAAAYGAAVPGVSQGSAQAALLAEQTAPFGAYGLGKTMQAASGAEGLSTGQGLMGQYGGNLMSNLGGPRGQRLAMDQGLKMMQPEPQPQMVPPQRYQHQEQKLQSPYQDPYGQQQEIPEELKRKLRAMGYPI